MAYPTNDRHRQLCVVVTGNGVTIYGNPAGMRTISRWLAWIAKSRPSEHFECHVGWHLTSHFGKRKNVWFLFDDAMRPRRARKDRATASRRMSRR